MGIKVEWIDRVLDKIGAKKEHYALLHEAQMLRKRVLAFANDKIQVVKRTE